MPTPRRRPALRLRADGWEKACRREGLNTDVERAKALGVSRPYVTHVQNRDKHPGAGFVAAALVAFPLSRFAELFEVAP